MSCHVIRLRGPWHYQPLARTVLLDNGTTRQQPGQLPPPGKARMPSDWSQSLGADFRGRVRFTRFFHRPTGLDGRQRIELVVHQVDAFGSVSLNGTFLGEICMDAGPVRFDISHQLESRNELTIEVELPDVTDGSAALVRSPGREGKPGGLVGEVGLEIR